eukprot:scaffold7378_cov410-Prasinococcus_capsulatus_cf.AAC.10
MMMSSRTTWGRGLTLTLFLAPRGDLSARCAGRQYLATAAAEVAGQRHLTNPRPPWHPPPPPVIQPPPLLSGHRGRKPPPHAIRYGSTQAAGCPSPLPVRPRAQLPATGSPLIFAHVDHLLYCTVLYMMMYSTRTCVSGHRISGTIESPTPAIRSRWSFPSLLQPLPRDLPCASVL